MISVTFITVKSDKVWPPKDTSILDARVLRIEKNGIIFYQSTAKCRAVLPKPLISKFAGFQEMKKYCNFKSINTALSQEAYFLVVRFCKTKLKTLRVTNNDLLQKNGDSSIQKDSSDMVRVHSMVTILSVGPFTHRSWVFSQKGKLQYIGFSNNSRKKIV